jgi:hypothetical protein
MLERNSPVVPMVEEMRQVNDRSRHFSTRRDLQHDGLEFGLLQPPSPSWAPILTWSLWGELWAVISNLLPYTLTRRTPP